MTTQEDIEFVWILEDGVRARDPLMYPPWHMDLHTNTKYHKLVDILGYNETQELMKKVKRDNREEPLWIHGECPICWDKRGVPPSVILDCNCRKMIYHLDWVLISPEQLQKNKDIKHKKRAAKMKVLAHAKKQALLVFLQEGLHKQWTHFSSSLQLGASNLCSEKLPSIQLLVLFTFLCF
ncbi:hypothetical protein B0H17DRAFT_1134431 [Mycena rosella]|uniref:Uncharacterized protein n=1 Tax=Mycena rosella TaxID=1033263 RepID=A0AAD7DFV4_MYCRO|nr:hypothetical protein B0H17DRAFT_1134431 [Mycena rosella]